MWAMFRHFTSFGHVLRFPKEGTMEEHVFYNVHQHSGSSRQRVSLNVMSDGNTQSV